MIGETVCHYRIIEELGGGGMGVVYRAEDTRLKRTVALKFLSPELTRDERAKHRFLAEAQAASRLDHPNILTIHEIEETEDGQLFLVMSCYEGETVRERLERGPMPVDEAVGLAVHVARGLEAAHAKGIVHRDIKPGNIFLTNDNRAKILDFGLAKLSGQTRITRIGSTVGTVAYMSPEQAHGGDVEASTDIWSLGVVLYEALTGGLPFSGERPESVLYSVVHEEPEPLGALRHDAPPELEAIIDRCLRKKPGERFASASELISALEPLGRGRTSGSSPIRIGSTTRIPVLPARRRGLVVAAVVLLACVGLALVPPVQDVVRSWLGVGGLPELKQVAVLPFRNAGDSSDDAFVDGLRRHLIFRLSQLEKDDKNFRVIPATELERHSVTTPEEALGVSGATHALEGTVERRGDDVSLMLDLVDTRLDSSANSRPWQDNLANIAACQQGPVIATAYMLGLTLEGPSRQALSAGCTTVPGALERYLEGLGRLRTPEDDSTDHIADAVSLFEEALALDPSYALAHVGLGEAYWSAFNAKDGDQEDKKKGADAARAAIELDDNLADAHVMLGVIEAWDERYPEAALEFTKALEIDPVNYRAHLGLAKARADGDAPYDVAERTYKEAIAVRRKHWAPHFNLGRFYLYEERHHEALRAFDAASALAPDNPWPHLCIGAVYFADDGFDEASATWERALDLATSPADCRMVYSNLGTCYFVQSLYADAVKQFEMALKEDATNYITWGNMAAAYDVLPDGEEKAVEHYTRALELGEVELRFRSDDERVLASMASYSAELGDSARAWDYLARAMKLRPEDDEVMFYIGLAHEVLGERKVAIDWIVGAVESGYSREQVETTPGLRGLCSDERYHRLAGGDGGR